MIRKTLIAALFLILVQSGFIAAQTTSISPYSRFGPGDLLFTGYAHQQGMGGTSIADYSVARLNFSNPATYAYDSLFVLEFALTGEVRKIEQNNKHVNKNNSTMSYLTFGMPIVRNKVGLSFGLIPYSGTGYDIISSNTLDSNGTYTSFYQGDGGYTRFFLGSGFKISEHFSAGFNASYLFGTTNKTSKVQFSSSQFFNTRYKEELRISDFYYEFGLHWQHELKNNYHLAVGLNGAPAIDVKSKSTQEWINYSTGSTGIESVRDTILYVKDKNGEVALPQYIGLGLALSKGLKWTLLSDVSVQNWSTYSSPSNADSLANSFRISFGGHYTPDLKGTSIFERINYRAGLYYNRTFLDLKSNQLSDQGVTIGMGIPIRKAYQSMVNFTLQAGQRGTQKDNLVREQYLKFQIGLTFNEDWFRRSRYD